MSQKVSGAKLGIRKTQEERREKTREKILDAAEQVLYNYGYSGFRVSKVAEVAGVSRGAQTHHFPTKDDLLVATLEEVYAKSQNKTLDEISKAGSRNDAIAMLHREYERFFLSPHFAMSLSLVNTGDSESPLDKELKRLAAENRAILDKAWTDVLVSHGIPQEISEMIVSASACIYRGLAVRQIIMQDEEHVQAVEAFWNELISSYLENLK